MDNITNLSISRIFPNPNQPRKDFDQDKLEELAMSIKEYGVLEPIVVTPRKDFKGITITQKGKTEYNAKSVYMIIAGERRWRASQIAELKKIPARVIKADDALVEELSLLENIQRQDLNIIEEGRAYQNLLNRGWTVEELAKKLGYKKTGPIYDRLQLLELKPDLQAKVISGEINPSQAYELSRLSRDKQDMVYLKIKKGELNTYNKLYAFVTAMIDLENQTEIFALTPLSEKESDSIKTFNNLITSIERFLKRVHEEDRLKHLEKVVLHTDITCQRLDLIINQLQKIRRIVLVGEGVKKAKQVA